MNSTGKYILVGQTAVEEPDLSKWAEWFETIDNRRVALTELPECRISTVFLGLDHNFGFGGDQPILFETMVFGKDHNNEWTDFGGRCSTWAEAEAMHAETVEQVKREIAARAKA